MWSAIASSQFIHCGNARHGVAERFVNVGAGHALPQMFLMWLTIGRPYA
jgi:hypothetical protein